MGWLIWPGVPSLNTSDPTNLRFFLELFQNYISQGDPMNGMTWNANLRIEYRDRYILAMMMHSAITLNIAETSHPHMHALLAIVCGVAKSTAKIPVHTSPDSKVHGVNMGPTSVLSAPDGPPVGPMNLAIREYLSMYSACIIVFT